jgi:hypothetical protein
MSDLDALSVEVSDYLKGSRVIKTDNESYDTLVIAPVESGPGLFMKVEEIPMNEMPKLTEQKMDFVTRYVTEYRQLKDWAEVYHVHFNTISDWLRDPAVQQYVARLRYERRMFNMAVILRTERLTFNVFNEILALKLDKSTMAIKFATAKFLAEYLGGRTATDGGVHSNAMRSLLGETRQVVSQNVKETQSAQDEGSLDDAALRALDAGIRESEEVLDNIKVFERVEKGEAIDAEFVPTGNGSGLSQQKPPEPEEKEKKAP